MSQGNRIILWLIGVTVYLAYSETKAAAEPEQITLAKDGATSLPICLPDQAGPETRICAQILADKLTKISGAPFQITKISDQPSIVVGIVKEFPTIPAAIDVPSDDYGDQGYRITCLNHRVYLLARSAVGLENAVWDILARLGYRQYFPGEIWEIIPRQRTLVLGIDSSFEPSFFYRAIDIGAAWRGQNKEIEDWWRRNRLSIPGVGFYLYTSHGYDRIIKQEMAQFERHPEYAALVDGQRKLVPGGNSTKFCVSNPGLQQVVVDYVRDYFHKNPSADVVSLEPSDGGGYCECDACRHLGSISDQVVTLANVAAKAIHDEFPNKYIGILAYGYHGPPPTIPVDPHVIVTPTAGFLRGASLDDIIAGWKSKNVKLGIYEYLSILTWNYDKPGTAHGSDISYLAKTVPSYYEQGIRFYIGEGGGDWGPCGLGYYYLSRILWDVKEAGRFDDIRQTFLSDCFGPVASEMGDFYRLTDASSHPLLSEDLLGRLYLSLHLAYQANPPTIVTRRLDALSVYVGYLDLLFQYENATGTARSQLFERILRYSYAEKDEMMFHTNYVWRLAEKGRIFPEQKIPKEALTDASSNPWKVDQPLSHADIQQMVASGASSNRLQEFASRDFSQNLVPVEGPPLAKGILGNSYDQAGAQQKQSYFIWLDKDHQSVSLKVTGGLIHEYRGGNIAISTYSSEDLLGKAVLEKSVPSDGLTHEVVLASPFAGLHRVDVVPTGSDAVRVVWPDDRPAVSQTGPNPDGRLQLRKAWSLYFYVPEGTKVVGGYCSNLSGTIVDEKGETVFDFKKLKNTGSFSFVPPVDARYLKFENNEGFRILLTVPPYLGTDPRHFLIPKEVAPQTALQK